MFLKKKSNAKMTSAAAGGRKLGHIDGVDGFLAKGWVYDSNDPERRPVVQIICDGNVVGEGVADLYRDDLQSAGFGDGRHGFSLLLDKALFDGEERTLSLIDKEHKINLGANELTIGGETQADVRIDNVQGYDVVGIVSNASNDINSECIVCVFIDDELVATSGLQSTPIRSEFRFCVTIPSRYCDGEPHVFLADVAGHSVKSIPHVDILPAVMTPWEHIKSSYRHPGYASLSNRSSYRYEALRASMDYVSTPIELRNLRSAHDVVVEGHEQRKQFPVLTLPETDNPTVSVIVPVYNQFAMTYHCIAALILAANKVSYELIIVDDASSDKTTEIEDIVENLVLIRNDPNVGFLHSCNRGANAARGDYLVFLNNDTEVSAFWLDEMVSVFDRFAKVGAVGSKLVYPDGMLQDAGGIIWDSGTPWNVGHGANTNDPQYNYTREVDYLTGASLMIDKNVWTRVGGFSEEFAPAYYEDTDIAFKIRDAGFRTFYCPKSTVVHFEGQSNGTDLGSGIKRYQKINATRFKANWRHQFFGKGAEGQNLHIHKDRNRDFRILMFDHAFPCEGQDAGSYAAIQEMKLMMELGAKLTFVPHNFAHLGKYTEELQRMGVECIYAPFYTGVASFLSRRGSEFDAVYITRYSVAERVIPLIREHCDAKILFNNADLHFLRELRAALASGEQDLSGPRETRDRELAVMNQVDAILSYNETEHEIIASHTFEADKIFKCPWVLQDLKSSVDFEQRQGIAFLGGFGHPPNREAIEFFIRDVVPLLRESDHVIPFHVYGSKFPDELEYLASDDVIIEGFAESLDTVFDSCRVFVAPLLSGAGIKGKVLDSIAYAVPSVLSPVAAEATGLVHGVSTLIAQSPQQWADSIIKLYTDEAFWQQVRNSAHTLVAEEYSAEAGLARMNRVFEHCGLLRSKNNRNHFNR